MAGTRTRTAPAGKLGFRGTVRFLWTQLTSMRTALVLLFALALAAIPGSLIPQTKVSPIRVDDFIDQHPTLGPIYDKVGLFDVYSSPWFSAIYLLLFVSLVGCIIPRVGVYAKALRNEPPKTPRNLTRLPSFRDGDVGPEGEDDLLDRAAAALKSRRYRVRRMDDSVSAERGYLREAGNLVFHISLLFVLLGVALGGLLGFKGTGVVVVGQGFANSLTQYDDFTAGSAFQAHDLEPFSLTVDKFVAEFETGPVQTGAARVFEATVSVIDRPGGEPRTEQVEVNKPLRVDGTTVHLIQHGYAPIVTVKDADGNVAYSGPVIFLPQDGNFSSAGVIKAPDGRPERLAFEGFFLPTAVVDDQGPRSVFPDAVDPAMFLNAWYGPPRTETGEPQNVYSLDTTGMSQFTNDDGTDVMRFMLRPGEYKDLPDGKGSISFDGYERWVKLQVSDTPGIQVALVAIGAAVLGLCLSLFIRPRRIWIRLYTTDGSRSKVQVAGLDRAEARTGLTEEVEELLTELGTAGNNDTDQEKA